MSNPFQLIIPLKQHTPIIHFQHEQAGATLRATELKPKIDRFICENHEALPELATYVDIIQQYWIVPMQGENKNKAFNSPYKLRVIGEVDNNQKYLLASRLDYHQDQVLKENNIKSLHGLPYFAQEKEITQLFKMGRVWDDRKNKEISVAVDLHIDKLSGISKWGISAISNRSKVDQENPLIFYLQINSLIPQICELMEIVIPYVLVCENFGTRQNKGFGSFTPMGITESEFEAILVKCFKFVYKSATPGNTLQDVFKTIQNEYQVLKAGRIHGNYAKSKLFLYGVEKMGTRWEKRKIKQEINGNIYEEVGLEQKKFPPVYDENGRTNWKDDPNPFNYKYLRALLGLAEQYEFLTTEKSHKYIVQVKSKNEIERYKSPLLYKVFNNRIYLVGSEVDSEMLGKWFDFQLKYKEVRSGQYEHDPKAEKKDFERSLESLQTPESFSLEAFISFALTNNRDEKIGNYQNLKK